jgi:UDP-N-acetyl-D-glucosamine/UDP-N-acetyl-D-galactosamine dehydrogenase
VRGCSRAYFQGIRSRQPGQQPWPHLISELVEYGIEPFIHDPLADPNEGMEAYAVGSAAPNEIRELDGLIIAVPHFFYSEMPPTEARGFLELGSMLSTLAFAEVDRPALSPLIGYLNW